METIKKVARSFLKMVTLETFYKISWPFCSGCLMWQVNIAGNLSTSYSEMDLRISGSQVSLTLMMFSPECEEQQLTGDSDSGSGERRGVSLRLSASLWLSPPTDWPHSPHSQQRQSKHWERGIMRPKLIVFSWHNLLVTFVKSWLYSLEINFIQFQCGEWGMRIY